MSADRYNQGKKIKQDQQKVLKIDRLRKFYEQILSDINTYCPDQYEKQTLISRLNNYISLKANSVQDVS